jgi:large subunit ribosomal protein L22
MDDVKAQARFVRGSQYKLRRYADLVRGKPALEAVDILLMSQGANSGRVLKVVKSAIANAENNHDFDAAEMFVKEIFIDEGPVMRRWRPRARGRATPIRKKLSHITVKLAPRGED